MSWTKKKWTDYADSPVLEAVELDRLEAGIQEAWSLGQRIVNALLAGGSAPPSMTGQPAQRLGYIIPDSATGDWAGFDRRLAWWNGSAWDIYAPYDGLTVVVQTTGTYGPQRAMEYWSGAWVDAKRRFGAVASPDGTTRIDSSGNAYFATMTISALTNGALPRASTAGGLLGDSAFTDDGSTAGCSRPYRLTAAYSTSAPALDIGGTGKAGIIGLRRGSDGALKFYIGWNSASDATRVVYSLDGASNVYHSFLCSNGTAPVESFRIEATGASMIAVGGYAAMLYRNSGVLLRFLHRFDEAADKWVLGTRNDDGSSRDFPLEIPRASASALKLNRSVEVSGAVGFNGAPALAKPAITGSRGSNSALADLLAKLVSYGLITDSTTA